MQLQIYQFSLLGINSTVEPLHYWHKLSCLWEEQIVYLIHISFVEAPMAMTCLWGHVYIIVMYQTAYIFMSNLIFCVGFRLKSNMMRRCGLRPPNLYLKPYRLTSTCRNVYDYILAKVLLTIIPQVHLEIILFKIKLRLMGWIIW